MLIKHPQSFRTFIEHTQWVTEFYTFPVLWATQDLLIHLTETQTSAKTFSNIFNRVQNPARNTILYEK